MIETKIILDSVNENGNRLITLYAKYPRIILPEVNTHRVFSRNSKSSRAIPVSRMLQEISKSPFVPSSWAKNEKGMSASENLTGVKSLLADIIWHGLKSVNVLGAKALNKVGVHKEYANRVVESWMFSETIISSTEWVNFLKLRNSDLAQPEIHELADSIEKDILESTPTLLKSGEWHIPFILESENYLSLKEKLEVSVARCARTSYKTFDGTVSTVSSDFDLYKKLRSNMHMSPFEHQAMASNSREFLGNFKGFTQYRKTLSMESFDNDSTIEEYLTWVRMNQHANN